MMDQSNDNSTQKKPNESAIPDKRYFSIGEVSALCGLEAHVLRYWEQEFSQLKPIKRRGNRRYYQRKDVLLIREIRHLLYEEGFRIEGARAKLTGSSERIGPAADSLKDIVAEAVSKLETVLTALEKAS